MNAKLLILRPAAYVSPTNGVKLWDSSFFQSGVLIYLNRATPSRTQGHACAGSVTGDEGGGRRQ